MIQAFNISPTKKLIVPGSFEDTIKFAAEHFITCAQQSIKAHGKFFVALSGGSTPKAIFSYLTQHFLHQTIWQKTFVFWGDERAVGPFHSESNYKMAMDSGFAKLPIPPSQIFRMHAEEDISKGAKDYEALIKTHLPNLEFDLVMLGMGDDGHTASLFPLTQALEEKNSLVAANFIPSKNCWRMTLTYPIINKALHIVFYVTGAAKKVKLNQVFQDEQSINPCSRVGTASSPALWIADKEAAELAVENLL